MYAEVQLYMLDGHWGPTHKVAYQGFGSVRGWIEANNRPPWDGCLVHIYQDETCQKLVGWYCVDLTPDDCGQKVLWFPGLTHDSVDATISAW